MTDDLRAVLNQVAEGRIDPAEAARLIDRVSVDQRSADPDAPSRAATDGRVPGFDDIRVETESETAGSGSSGDSGSRGGAVAGTSSDAGDGGNVRIRPPSAEEPTGTVQRVVVQASARSVRVIADHAVDTITAEGPHTVHRDGDVLRVEAGSPVSSASGSPPGSYRFERRSSGLSRWLSQATQLGVPLIVRVNPRLRVDMEVMAGSLEVMGLRAPFSFSVTAGSLRANDCAGPFTGAVRAGSARLEVRPESGVSSVRVESGSVDVRLMPGSSVRIRARAELGEVKIKGPDGSARTEGASAQEIVVGAGAAVLEVDAVMGSVKVHTP